MPQIQIDAPFILDDALGGEVAEEIQRALDDAAADLSNPRKKASSPRGVDVKIRFIPQGNSHALGITAHVTPVLAPTAKLEGIGRLSDDGTTLLEYPQPREVCPEPALPFTAKKEKK
ncbi:MAG: hypothetical protein GY719_26095 [bacterium]|nr:hypothetical protein [bacterium]